MMNNRLLLVEPSATMRYVLEKHARSLGYRVESVDDYAAAAEALTGQYQQFGDEYAGLLFGWPPLHDSAASELAEQLEQSEFRDLPVLVMSTDMRAETRAWVSARPYTALLAWKNYQQLESLLQRLMQPLPDSDECSPEEHLDNSDITLMVIDDSATIRLSLRDLFEKQGYRVLLAASEEEALANAARHRIDIAVVDYYLGETTGDTLCQLLLSDRNQPDLFCTVLTGTYADHIIRRSLRAGAIECMFKNESSELLLGRIDALARFVRERRRGGRDRRLLEQALERRVGAFVLVDESRIIAQVSESARRLIGLEDDVMLEGQPAEMLMPIEAIDNPVTGQWRKSDWRRPDGSQVSLAWRLDIDDQASRQADAETVNAGLFLLASPDAVPESPAPAAPESEDVATAPTPSESVAESVGVPDAASAEAHSPAAASPQGETTARAASAAAGSASALMPLTPRELIDQLELDEESLPFLQCIRSYLDDINDIDEHLSLLCIDVFMIDDLGRPRSVEQVLRLEPLVRRSLHAMYQRAHHVAGLKGNRYGFILRHREESQAYLLTRKIMQLTNNIRLHEDGPQLATSASLLSLTKNSEKPLEALLKLGFRALDVVNAKDVNQALLVDLRRMLSVYPPEEIR
ncbi:MAG: hypothetical protein CSB44_05285 [Gammaproteobacteria bacterium]|nr:MAG: hypothetical protein CSB44_05285 [Gammaproteobacteria bacterium]